MTYRPPLRDLAAALKAAGYDRLGEAFPEADEATAAAILEAAGEFAADVIAPLNRPGDLAGATYANGAVTAAPGYADAYRQYALGGWNSLSAEPEFGGQGLPKALEIGMFEMIQAASLAFGLCPMLTQGAIEALTAHGTDRQKALYLPKLVSGEWTGTMNLTEPQAGSDLAALTTRAEPDGEGGYRLTGQKIFITWGDHDATDNIVHLVLARLPDAPAGSRGISLFLASKFLVGDGGDVGARNDVRPVGVEHKLGIHASPTCVMAFEGAKAELVGEENNGLAAMFTMMNAARLQVGTQGVAIAERAYQQALEFSRERKQGRSAWTGANPAPIHDHPDVRRTLLLIKAKTQAARAICLATAVAADLSRHAATPEARETAKLREELLTPIAKGWSTDMGVEAASLALQVHGGMGFIEETGAAQHYRDARILPIYEGTNGIQAMDLIGRKLSMAGGAAIRGLIAEIRAEAVGNARLLAGVAALEEATDWLIAHKGAPDALAGATPYLKLAGDVVGGWMLSKMAGEGEDYARLDRFYAEQVLAGAPGLVPAVVQGAAVLEEAL
ncbi:acyl-CoA dehydrogenase [Caulobacter mirabilis]|uniref:3-methylmercaptopropionyl-CoA dehydrogenase n=1 Tax=Caulobacter mirabilis TaxID=69666 RepID=A0A2D2B1U9_9CAUL|nr:acyl-CoA dehydrogenase [Caulobacter mirabilis]ATQ44242.1 acyl-CoA dehydrogenase [Caulobacter mirabilis]